MSFNEEIAAALVTATQVPSSNAVLRALDLKVERVTQGGLEVSVRLDASLAIPGRNIAHGGIVAILSDHALATVFYPLAENGAWVATQGFSITYLAPVPISQGAKLVGVAKVVYLKGASGVCSVDCFVVQGDKRTQVSAAQGTVRLIGKPKL